MIPYVIWAPPYTHRSGGVRALYQLRDLLIDAGCGAVIQRFENGAPCDTAIDSTGAIVVYPEIIVGNPAGADRVVRWLLSPAERPDLCFQWLPFDDHLPVLHVPIVDTDLFYPRRPEGRYGVAWWAGKASAEHRGRYMPEQVAEICWDVPSTRAELADMLGSLQMLISLDGYSSLNLEAAMCGTPVRVYSETQWDRTPLDSNYTSTAGIAYDDEPWEKATSTVTEAYDRYVAAEPAKIESVKRFIEITQEQFA